MKKTFLLVSLLISAFAYSQPNITPLENAEICPEATVEIAFDYYPSSYFISTSQGHLKGIELIRQLKNGRATIKFKDVKGPHSFKLWSRVVGEIKTYTFTKIKTLKGLKPKYSTPPGGPAPTPGYDFTIYDPKTAPCSDISFVFSAPRVKFRQTSTDSEYGGPLEVGVYEWMVPKGWKVGNEISTGTNIIVVNSAFGYDVVITPDKIGAGDIRVRARSFTCGALQPSDWFNMNVPNRLPLFLTVNGQNPITITCGDVSEKTFTLNNSNYYTCITGYFWQIGANWQLPNGTPAPSTITTTTNSLTLKHSLGGNPGVVTVSPIINGVANVNSYSCSTNFKYSRPNISVDGAHTLCSTAPELYTLSGPLNLISSLSWSSNPSDKLILSPGTNSVSASRNGDGQAVLVATTNICGRQEFYSHSIYLGLPSQSPYNIEVFGNGANSQYELCPNTNYYIEASFSSGASQIEWLLPEGWVESNTGSNGPFVTSFPIVSVISASLSSYSFNYIRVRAINDCGYGQPAFLEVATNCNGGGYMGLRSTDDKVKLYPNPAKNNVNIKLDDKEFNSVSSKESFYKKEPVEIIVTDITGKVRITRKLQHSSNIIDLNISVLPTGYYQITIIKNDRKYTKILIVSK